MIQKITDDDFQDLIENQPNAFNSCIDKYQKALDTIKVNEDENYTIESVWNAIDTLQELINKLQNNNIVLHK